ncbi:MAG: chromosomal replication initiator protein DnaA [Candidatus Babeliales bacterium]
MQLIWDEFLKLIKQEAGSQIVETWFKAVSLQDWNTATGAITLKTPNQFVSKWIQEHYIELLKKHLSRLLHVNEIKIIFICSGQEAQQIRNIIPASTIQTTSNQFHITHSPIINSEPQQQSKALVKVSKKNQPNQYGNNLNENYIFENFIVGPNNSLANAAAIAVVENLGKVYNPLFIYGGTGLGKTHLMHAIGNAVKKKYPNITVCYETTDRFITEFINCIRFDKADQFRSKYQKLDLFLLDDVQFLSNKEQTQEIFFHIFNNLYEERKQIIMSSDTFPKEIAGLQSRLKSRLEWGLVADIQIPDLETKIAILNKKAEQNKMNLPNDVANFIASRVISNIRELEGALVRVSAFAALINTQITIELAQKVLLNLSNPKTENASLETVLKIAAKNFDVSILDIKAKKRHKEIAEIRQIVFYLMKKLTNCSLQVIGSFVGGRDHSTVIHAIGKVEKMCSNDLDMAKKIKRIEQEIMMN